MSRDIADLLPLLDDARRQAAPLVMATVVATEGSTYRKPGARMLFDPRGDAVGVIAGGCFEGDLADRARAVALDGRCRRVVYDMRGEDDEIWGLGLGCEGAVTLLLHRLDPGNHYQPLAAIAEAIGHRRRCVVATVVDDDAGTGPLGATLVLDDGGATGAGLDPNACPGIVAACRRLLDPASGAPEPAPGVRLERIAVPPRLLILGAGPDAVPVARLALALHFRVTVADHREAWARPERFPPGCTVIAGAPDSLRERVDLGDVDAAVVMSHNYAADLSYLRQLATAPPAYLGLLGPTARRNRLLDELGGARRRALADSLRGPVGLDLGGETPAAIALSLMAEVHAVLEDRTGLPMSVVKGGARAAS